MHPNGPPRLHINPPYYQQQRAPTSAPYFSSPATYNPLPFTQQNLNSGENGGFFPGGRQDGIGHAGLSMNVAPMMGLGLSQMSEAPSMLRSSSSSSYSSTSSFVPSTPNTFGAYFSPPLQRSSPALFSPTLPASPSFASDSIRPIPPRTKLRAHAPSFHASHDSNNPSRRSTKHPSISVRGGNPFPQRHGRNESTFKATTPLGIGTRPDEEVKKKKKILVRIPRELEREKGEEENELGDNRKQSRFFRVPLGRDDKLRKMEDVERDLEDGSIMLEEDEIVGKSCHYDEQKSTSLPSTIEVYLPGLAGWEVAWEEFSEQSYARSGSFDVPKPTFLDPVSPTLPRSGNSSPHTSLSPSTPLHAAPPPPRSSQRSHTRTFSLFDSPVALPARLQNVLDSLSGRRASMSLSTSKDQLNPAATPFSTRKPPSQSKLTPFAPAFTLPSWAAIKARAQGVPLPDTDESMEEGMEEENLPPNDSSDPAHELVESLVALEQGLMARREVGEISQAVGEVVKVAKDEAKEGGTPTRKMSGVSTRTDRTGTASVSDGFLEKEGDEEESRNVLVESPHPPNAHLDNFSPDRPPSSLGDEIGRALSDLGPLETTADLSLDLSSNQLSSIPSASKEEAAEGEHKVNKSFEFPLRSPAVSPEKPRPAQLLPSETLASTPLESVTKSSPDIPTTLTFRPAGEDSLQNSPSLFGWNGAPGPLTTSSSRNDTPSPPSAQILHPSLSNDDLTITDLEPLHALRPLSYRNEGNGEADSSSRLSSPSAPLVRPMPRRPHLDHLNDTTSTSTSPFALSTSSDLPTTSSMHSFDFRLPSNAPQLPPHQQSDTPRKISHGPLPPIPLLAVTSSHDSPTKRQRFESFQTGIDVVGPDSLSRAVSTPNIATRRPLPTPPSDYRPRTPSNYRASYDFGSLFLASLEDAIPEQYSPKRTNPLTPSEGPFESRTTAAFSSNGRILGFNGGTSSKVRSPSPKFSTPGSSIDVGSSNQRGRQESTDINLPTTSRSKSRAVAISSRTVDVVDERDLTGDSTSADSSQGSSVVELSEDGLLGDDEDDMPLRILEGIIERQFDGLRAELKSATSTLQQDNLVEAVARRLEEVLVSMDLGRSRALSISSQQFGVPHSIPRPSTPTLESHPAAAYGVFLDDLRATVLPLLQVPLDTNALTTKLSNQLQGELARHSKEMLKMIDPGRNVPFNASAEDLKNIVNSQESTNEAVKDLGSSFAQLAQGVNRSEAASTNLKSTMGQLSLDVTSRLDSAYSALDTLLQTHLDKLPSPDHLTKIKELEAQLTQARNDHGKVRSEKAVLEERLANEQSRHVDKAAQLRSELLNAQATIRKLEVEKLESTAKSARLEADLANSQNNLQNVKQVSLSREERLKTVLNEKSKLTFELCEARVQIESLTLERHRLSQNHSHPRSPAPIFDHARLDSTESDPDLSSTPPSRPVLFKHTSSSRPSTPTKLVPQLTGDSDDSDDTIAHTDLSPSPSVLARSFALSDDGWYSEA